MPTSEINRLLVVPAIVLAATLSLTGCANLPFFGSDSGSSNNSSSKDEDEDEDEDDEEEEDEDDDSGNSGGGCPREFLAQMEDQSAAAESGFENATVTEIDPRLFEPAALSDSIDGGCVFVIEYTQDGVDSTIFQAYVPGGDDVLAEMDAALVADGYDDTIESMYIKDDDRYVITYGSEDGFTSEQLEEYGLDELGDDLVVVLAYQGQV